MSTKQELVTLFNVLEFMNFHSCLMFNKAQLRRRFGSHVMLSICTMSLPMTRAKKEAWFEKNVPNNVDHSALSLVSRF